MKSKLLLLGLLSGMFLNVQGQKSKVATTFNDIFKIVNQTAQVVNNVTASIQDLGTTTIVINSTSNAHLMGGHTRGLVAVHLPRGTEKWFYRITVLDKKSNYSYQSNESLYYVLRNNLQDNIYRPTTDGVDFFLLHTSGDANSFSETGNNNFSYIDGYSHLNVNSFYEGSNIVEDNLWIGVRNNNYVEGLRIIVEVVAYGHFY
jgi:hypothetical protein